MINKDDFTFTLLYMFITILQSMRSSFLPIWASIFMHNHNAKCPMIVWHSLLNINRYHMMVWGYHFIVKGRESYHVSIFKVGYQS